MVDCHVQNQRAVHLVAKAAEVRADVEVAVSRGESADLAGRQGARHDRVGSVPSPRLAHHVELARAFGGRHHPPGLIHG